MGESHRDIMLNLGWRDGEGEGLREARPTGAARREAANGGLSDGSPVIDLVHRQGAKDVIPGQRSKQAAAACLSCA